MFIKVVVPSLAIVCITVIELMAMYKGLNGTMLSISIAAIAGIGGYQIHNIKTKGGSN